MTPSKRFRGQVAVGYRTDIFRRADWVLAKRCLKPRLYRNLFSILDVGHIPVLPQPTVGYVGADAVFDGNHGDAGADAVFVPPDNQACACVP